MARTRHIKPGFHRNEVLAECDPLARLLFTGLWTIADREGRLEDRPKRIKADVLPYDNCDVDDLLDQLAERGFITRYSCNGQGYISIPTFIKNQQPHVNEAPSVIPAPNDNASNKEEYSTSTVQVHDNSGANSPRTFTLKPFTLEPELDSPAATPQAATVEPQPPPRQINPVPKATPKPKPKEKPPLEWPDSFDVNTLWLLIEDDQGYPPAWNYGRETLAVYALLKKHPNAIPDDFAAFIRYRWKCFRGDPNAQPTFSEVPANFTSWLERGKPELPQNEKGQTDAPTRRAKAITNGFKESFGVDLDTAIRRGSTGPAQDYTPSNLRQLPSPKSHAG